MGQLRPRLKPPSTMLCLGIGKVSSDRTAQVQLALLLLLIVELEVSLWWIDHAEQLDPKSLRL